MRPNNEKTLLKSLLQKRTMNKDILNIIKCIIQCLDLCISDKKNLAITIKRKLLSMTGPLNGNGESCVNGPPDMINSLLLAFVYRLEKEANPQLENIITDLREFLRAESPVSGRQDTLYSPTPNLSPLSDDRASGDGLPDGQMAPPPTPNSNISPANPRLPAEGSSE